MQKVKNGIRIGVIAILFALVAAIAIVAAAPARARAADITVERPPIDARYVTGDTFTLPVGVKLKENDKSYDASVILRDPEGRGYAQEQVTLTVAGVYTLEYRAVAENDRLLLATETFECANTLYTVPEKSTAEYTKVEKYSPQNGLDDAEVNQSGILVSLSSGDTFAFNRPIDVSTLTQSNTLIDLFVLPESFCTPDAAQIDLTLADAANPDNKVTVSVKKVAAKETGAVWAERASYLSAGATGQLSSGLESSASGDFRYEGGVYKLHKGDAYGAPVQFSLPGGWYDAGAQKYTVKVGTESLKLAFDAETNRVYANGTLVIDLDDALIFGADVWGGFEGRQVMLSLKCSSYNAAAANIMITRIADADIGVNAYFDQTAPVISLPFDASAKMPDAKVGAAYPVEKASATDNLDGAVRVHTYVWYNYGTPQATLVNTEDGKFVPRFAGEYTIEYVARDKEGNEGRERLTVAAKTDVEELAIVFDSTISEGVAGTPVAVAKPRFTGGSGARSVSVRAVLKSDAAVSYDVEGETFVPLYAGVYTVTYTATDYVFAATASYELTVAPATGAYIDDTVSLPRYIIAGAKYALPQKYGYTFENGVPKREPCTPSVDRGTIENGVLTVAAGNPVTVTYTLAGASKSFDPIPVINVGYGEKADAREYFLHDGFTAAAHASDIGYKASSGASSARLPFINAVQAKQLLLQLGIDASERDYGALTVWLADSQNDAVVQKLTYTSNRLIWNDTQSFILTTNPFGSAEGLEISYTESTNELRYTQTAGLYPQTDYNGNAFNGFPSGKVYLTLELQDIKAAGSAGVRIKLINNQRFNAALVDDGSYMRPQIVYTAQRGERTVGDTVVLTPAFAASVMDPYVEYSLSVLLSGNPVTDADGVTLRNVDAARSYTVPLTAYGDWRVTYSVRDGSGKQVTSGNQYIIRVGDLVAPEIAINSPNTSAKVGDTVAVAGVTLSDDVSAADKITVETYVLAPNGRMTDITQNGSFAATVKGVYTVYYRATDEAGNVSIASYRVTVA